MKLELNRDAEVAIHGQAADVEWTLERRGANDWLMVIAGVSDDELAKKGPGYVEPDVKQEFVLNDGQAAATMALFIGDDVFTSEDMVMALYSIAEQVWKNVPRHFRPIP